MGMSGVGLRAHWIQHVPFEGLGSIASWLERRGTRVSRSRMYEGAVLPRIGDIDLLVVMGGPMSVNDEAAYPWLRAEKRFIADAIGAGIAVMGVCLGAQLIAGALGAAVRRNAEPEIGWFPVERVAGEAADGIADVLPPRAEVFHWHGETFDLPPGARRIARNEACENQAFVLGERVLALQFHLEATPDSARALIENCPGDLVPGRYVQTGTEIMSSPERFQRINGVMDRVLECLMPKAGKQGWIGRLE